MVPSTVAVGSAVHICTPTVRQIGKMFELNVLRLLLMSTLSTIPVIAIEMFNNSVLEDRVNLNFKCLTQYDFETCSSPFTVYNVTNTYYKLLDNFNATITHHEANKDSPNFRGDRTYTYQLVNHAKHEVLNVRQVKTYGCTRLLKRVTTIHPRSKGTFSFEISATFLAEIVTQVSQYTSTPELSNEYVVYRLSSYPNVTIDVFTNTTTSDIFTPHAVTSEANIIIASDPQPFRHPNCSSPKQDEECWKRETEKSAMNFKALCRISDLCMVNGDMTESGRFRMWTLTLRRFLGNFTFFGLGNHDYQGNIDCHAGLVHGKDDCARNSVFMLEHQYPILERLLQGRNFWFDSNHLSNPDGSFAYGFDVTTNVHIIQANLEPKYEANLTETSGDAIHIRSSHELLKTKISEAKTRGQIVLLNYHLDNYADLDEYAEVAAGKLMLFHGHTHKAAARHTPKVKVYDSGALFLGDFIKVKINDKCIEIEHGNAIDEVSKFHENLCL